MNPEVTVVTGASAGIGQAIAQALIAQGRTVVNIDREAPAWSSPLLVSLRADLTDAHATREAAQAINRDYRVTALVNNAGATRPGTIDTELFRRSNPAGAPQTQRILDSIVVKRMGTPEDVARAAMFFLSPDNGFVTGQVLYVCGGTTLGVAPV